MHSETINYQDLVFIGGGHSHALVLKMWAMNPIAGIRLTLISPSSLTPYSGMLPGLVAGHYNFDETHIDLALLCQYAKVRFIQSSVNHIDCHNKSLTLTRGDKINFDLVSINTGITPELGQTISPELVCPVKPISEFYPRWKQVTEDLTVFDKDSDTQHISVVGAGAAGLEIILAMQYKLSNDSNIHCPLEFTLINQSDSLLTSYPEVLQKKLQSILAEKKIKLINNFSVSRAEKITTLSIRLHNAESTNTYNKSIDCQQVFWCTGAKAAVWPCDSGLDSDGGFIAVNDFLQSTSHDFVFACGDIAKQQGHETPRAGVHAVRQASTLFKNLQNFFLQKPLHTHKPQPTFLSLLACGEKYALGCRPQSLFPSLAGKWVWSWKNRIDKQFMNKFSKQTLINEMKQGPFLPALFLNKSTPKVPASIIDKIDRQENNAMRCGGCGAKVGARILSRVIRQLKPVQRDDILLGLHSGDDASAFTVPKNKVLVQSVDVFRALLGELDDPYLLGQIAAEHALSDLFAMHAEPHSALALVTLPYAAEKIVERDLQQLMSGALYVLNRHGCVLTGGHTSEGAELSIGFSVNGLADKKSLLHKSNIVKADKLDYQLILTQPLGTGCLFAAHAQLEAKGTWLSAARKAMRQSNRQAAEVFYRHDVTACTDVTGFGLAGHLSEMLKGQQLQADIKLSSLPALPGALDCLNRGLTSSLQAQNARFENIIESTLELQQHPLYPLLFDPQTSGGLLACVPLNQSDSCLADLHEAGYENACIIGSISETPFDSGQTDNHQFEPPHPRDLCDISPLIKLS